MPPPEGPGIPSENRLLATLPRKEYERLLPKLEPVALAFKQVLAEPDQPVPYVYFPRNGVISLVTYMADGSGSEVGILGNEGMAGISIFLGSGREPGRVFCQVPGEALCMKA